MRNGLGYLSLFIALIAFFALPQRAYAICPCPCGVVAPIVTQVYHPQTNNHISDGFVSFQEWFAQTLFGDNILPAMMSMTEQLTTTAIKQMEIIGMFMDAKHQLETQRLFQEMTAQAHKDYHPSEGVCTIGTNVRSLASSDRTTDYNTIVISNRTMQRQLISGNNISASGEDSDRLSRLDQFKTVYCNPLDNAMGLELLCAGGGPVERRNKDIDFTRTVDLPLTLELDFTVGNEASTPDEQDVFAMAANLYAHNTPPQMPESFLTDLQGKAKPEATSAFMNMRSVVAKRSVAQNSFAAITALKSAGAPEVQPYMYAILNDMGLPAEEIEDMLGERPSYFAQMEVLTKKLYQNPNFYSELYDKPANVSRKQVAMQAIDLMQKRDIFRSLLRSEAMVSVMLEMEVSKEQAKITNEVNSLNQTGTAKNLGR